MFTYILIKSFLKYICRFVEVKFLALNLENKKGWLVF